MHLLTVFSHPFTDKYPAAVMSAFHKPFVSAGHSIDVLDLHAEGFDPRLTKADHAYFWGGPVPADVAAHHRRVEKADRLAFVFPVYWWGMPAMMNGWIERVFTGGWALCLRIGSSRSRHRPPTSLLGNRPTILIGIGGSTRATYDKYGYSQAMRTQLDVGTFAYCGITDIESCLLFNVEGEVNAAVRTEGLKDVTDLARHYLSPDRQVRNAKEDHLSRVRAEGRRDRSTGPDPIQHPGRVHDEPHRTDREDARRGRICRQHGPE